MSSNIKISVEKINRLFELKEAGAKNTAIAKKLGISDAHVARLLFASSVHGADWLRANPTLAATSSNDNNVLAVAAETVIACGLPISKARIVFGVTERELRTAVSTRKTTGHALEYGAEPALPNGIDQAFVKDMIAELNDGKVFEILVAEHLASCKKQDAVFNEKTGDEIFEQKVIEARKTLNCSTFEPSGDQITDAAELWKHGAKPADLTGLMGISAPDASRIISFLNLHGADEYLRLRAMTEPGGFSEIDVASMVEFAIAYNLPDSKVSLIFKVTEGRLKRMRKSRLDNCAPVNGAFIAPLSSTIDISVVESWIFKSCNHLSIANLNAMYAYNRKVGNWTRENVLFCKEPSEITSRWKICLDECNGDVSSFITSSKLAVAQIETVPCSVAEESTPDSSDECSVSVDIEMRCGIDCFDACMDAETEAEAALEVTHDKEPITATQCANIDEKMLKTSARGLLSRPIYSGTSAHNRTTRDSLPVSKHGKAKATIKPYAAKKKDRNREIMRAEKLEKNRQDLLNGIIPKEFLNPMYAVDYIKISSDYSSPLDLITGIPAKEYPKIANNRGRVPDIDINSEGFEDLPDKVKYNQIKRAYDRLLSYTVAIKKKVALEQAPISRYLTKGERKELVIKCYEHLVKENPWLHIRVAMGVFGLRTSDFHYYSKVRTSIVAAKKESEDALNAAIIEIYNEFNGKIGVHRMRIELARRTEALTFSLQKIRRNMRKLWMFYVPPYKTSKYSSYVGTVGKLAPNLLKRKFKASRPYYKVVTDVTEITTKGSNKLYLSMVVDLFNNEILSWSISQCPGIDFVLASIVGFLEYRPTNLKIILHSDQGSQYQHQAYIDMIERAGNVIRSMSRKGNSLDNGAMESAFGRIKAELLALFGKFEAQDFETLEARIEYVINYWNNDRGIERLGGLSPIEYKNNWLKQEKNQWYVKHVKYAYEAA